MKVNKKALHVKTTPAVSGRPPKLPRVACYLRVSSRAQTAVSQLDAIQRVAAARGDRLATTYEEKRSAATMSRPELTRMRLDAQAGKIEKLYVFRLDRLSRTGIEDTLAILEELRGHGVKVVSVSDGFDLEGPAAEIIISVLAWAAKMERLVMRERVSAARDRIEAEGGTWGRPSELDPKVRAKIGAYVARGKTIRWIAAAVKIPRATVGRAAKALRAAKEIAP